MLQTICENCEEGYIKRQVEKATVAWEVQAVIGHTRSKQLVTKRVLKDCPVTANNFTNAVSIFGPDPRYQMENSVWTTRQGGDRIYYNI